MDKIRLDNALVGKGLVTSRSQAESYIKLGKVKVNGQAVVKAGHPVAPSDMLEVLSEQYVSRAALKLGSAAKSLGLDFKNKVVLDVGSSTGGFTDYALQHGAKRVIAVDVGTDQLHPSLRGDARIDLREKTDIRSLDSLDPHPDIVLIDVSFISLRDILPAVAALSAPTTEIIAMVKPQFEAGSADINKGVIKNDNIRRRILKDFEAWTRSRFIVIAKADSQVAGSKGNVERFYLLKKAA